MFGQQQGLSLEQAPPIEVVLRFFLGGALWGVAAGIFLLFNSDIKLYTNSGIITTHIFALGVVMSFMLGALMQMLPVLAGVVISNPAQKALRVQWLAIFGTVSLLLSFNSGWIPLYILSAILLGFAILPLGADILTKLVALRSHSFSSLGMSFALIGLIALYIIGLTLLGIRSGWVEGLSYTALKTAHYSFALFGWVALLIISVSFQVIEMFYVTSPYPKLIQRLFPTTINLLSLFIMISAILFPPLQECAKAVIYILLLAYALTTLHRLYNRKRAVSDATVWFWYIGMGALALSMVGALLSSVVDGITIESVAVVYVVFTVSVIFAMSYKIVPFLVWFHLNAQGYFKAPLMHEVIDPKYSKMHLCLHSITIILSLIASQVELLWSVAGVAVILSFGMLALSIYRAWHIYIDTQKSGERFDMGSFK